VPPYARDQIGAGPRLIGLLLLANAFTVALAQIPVARLAEGGRRALAMAFAALTFAAAYLLVLGADLAGSALLASSAAALAARAFALALERELPAAIRLTPRPHPADRQPAPAG
jgi:hypothetical protein